MTPHNCEVVERQLSDHVNGQEEGNLEINPVHTPIPDEVAPPPNSPVSSRTLRGTTMGPAYTPRDDSLFYDSFGSDEIAQFEETSLISEESYHLNNLFDTSSVDESEASDLTSVDTSVTLIPVYDLSTPPLNANGEVDEINWCLRLIVLSQIFRFIRKVWFVWWRMYNLFLLILWLVSWFSRTVYLIRHSLWWLRSIWYFNVYLWMCSLFLTFYHNCAIGEALTQQEIERRINRAQYYDLSDQDLRELGVSDAVIRDGRGSHILLYAIEHNLPYLVNYTSECWDYIEVQAFLTIRRTEAGRAALQQQIEDTNPDIFTIDLHLESDMWDSTIIRLRKKVRFPVETESPDDGTPVPEGLVFEGKCFFEETLLCDTMINIQWSTVPAFLSNINCQMNCARRDPEMVELFREYKTIRKVWQLGSCGREDLKRFLTRFNFSYEEKIDLQTATRPDWAPEYQYKPDIFFSTVQVRHLIGHTVKGEWEDPKFLIRGEEGPVALYFKDGLAKHRVLTFAKLHAMISDLKLTQTTREVFKKLKNKFSLSEGNKNWILGFVTFDWFYLHSSTGDDSAVMKLFTEYYYNFLGSFYDYCFKYMTIGDMTGWDRRDYYRERSKQFSGLMKSPKAQQMFLLGATKERVIETIFKEDFRKLDRLTNGSAVTRVISKQKGKLSHKERSKARDLKYTFEPESFSGCVTGSFLAFGFFSCIFYLFKRKQIEELLVRARKLSSFASNQLVAINDTVTKADKLVSKTIDFTEDLEKLFERNESLDKYGGIIADFKRLVQVIYYAIHAQYLLMVDSVTDLVLRYPSRFKDLSIAMFEGFIGRTTGIFDSFRQKPHFVAEAHGLEEVILSPFITLIHSFAGQKLTPMEMRDANTRMQYMTMNAKFWSDSATMFKSIISYIGRELFSYDPFDADQRSFSERVMRFIIEVDDAIMKEPHMPAEIPLCQHILALRDEGVDIKNDEKFCCLSSALRNLFQLRFAVSERLALKAAPIASSSGKRPEPVGILFTGPPGVGKSNTIGALAQFLTVLDNRTFHEQDIFYGNNQKHYDGYANQEHFVLDDGFAALSQDDRAQEAMFLIKSINSVPHPLEMAQCEAKGQVFFNSAYVYLSTNLANAGYHTCNWDVGASDSGAIKRRIHISLHRTDPYDETVPPEAVLYTVEKNSGVPGFRPTVMTVKQIAKLIYARRQLHKTYHLNNIRTDDQVRAIFAAESYYTDSREYFSKYMSLVCPTDPVALDYLFKGIMALVAGSALLTTAYALSKYFSVEEVQLESGPGIQSRFNRHTRSKPRNKEYVSTKYAPESRENFDSCLNNTVSKGLVIIETLFPDGTAASYNGFHIKGGVILTVCHGTVSALQRGCVSIRVGWSGGEQYIVPSELRMVRFENQDFHLFQLPNLHSLPPALYKYIVEEKNDVSLPQGMAMYILSVNSKAEPQFRAANKVTDIQDGAQYDVGAETFCIESAVSYYANTVGGDSGSAVAAMAKEGRVAICGMHLCGSANHGNTKKLGVALRFNQSEVDVWLSHFKRHYEPEARIDPPIQVSPEIPPVFTYPPQRSSFLKSPMFGWAGPSLKAPASLSDLAYEKAVSHVRQDEQDGKYHVSERAIEAALVAYPPIPGSKVRTQLESINGYVDSVGNKVPAMRMDTHGGYLYNPKSKFIARNVVGTYEPTPEFYRDINLKLLKLARDEEVEFIFYDCAKVELRTNEKVESHNSRLFSCSPLDLTVIMGMYFGDFCAYVQSLCTTQPISVGINVHSNEWKLLRDHVLSVGGGIVSGDFVKFDKDFKADVMMDTGEVINRWYNDGSVNAKIRMKILKALAKSKHILFDFFYYLTGGNPSGQRCTSSTNSLGLFMMLFDVFTLDFNLREDEFVIKVYGDDNLCGVPRGRVDYARMAQAFKERFDMKYTHWSKKEFSGVDTINDVRYLARAFEVHHNQVMAPLEVSTIEQMSYYYEGSEMEEVLISTSASYFLEASHLGETKFNELRTRYLEAVKLRMPQLYDVIVKRAFSYWYYYDGKYSEVRKVAFHTFPDSSGWTKSQFRETPVVLQVESCSEVNFPVATTQSKFVCESNESASAVFPQKIIFVPESKETKVTDPDLGVADEAAHQTSVLGSEVNIGAETGIDVRSFLYPMPTQKAQLAEIMGREYLVDTFDVSTSHAVELNVAAINFPRAILSADPNLLAIFQAYRYFRAGVEVRLVCGATKTCYGMATADWYPYHCGVTLNDQSTTIRSGRDHVLIRHEANQTIVLSFPFVNPNLVLNTQSFFDDEIGKFTVRLLTQLKTTNGVATDLTYQVYAKFTNPELYGPCPVPTFATMAEQEYMLVPESRVESMRKAAQDTASSLISTAKAAVAYVTTRAVVAALGNVVCLDKPSNTSLSGRPRISFWADDFHATGVDNAITFGVDQGTETASGDMFGRGDETSLAVIAGTPMILTNASIVSTGNPTFFGYLGNQTYGTFDFMLSSMFKYRSGGNKFKFYFSCSTQHSARFVIYIAPYTNLNGATAFQFCHHQIVDVIGPTDHEVFVPQMLKSYSEDRNNEEEVWGIFLQCVSFSAPLGTASPIFVTMYYSAAEDVQYASPIDYTMTFTAESNPRAEFKHPFAPLHADMTMFTQVGVLPDTYNDIRQLMKTKYALAKVANNGIIVYPSQYAVGSNVLEGLMVWNSMYLFRRGSICFKVNCRDPAVTGLIVPSDLSQRLSSTADIMTSAAPAAELKIPMYGTRYCKVIRSKDINQACNAVVKWSFNTASDNALIWSSAGDDYAVSHLQYPDYAPTFSTTNPTTTGIGLAVFYYQSG